CRSKVKRCLQSGRRAEREAGHVPSDKDNGNSARRACRYAEKTRKIASCEHGPPNFSLRRQTRGMSAHGKTCRLRAPSEPAKMTQPSHKLGAHPLIEFLSGMLSFPAKLRIRAWATSSPS